jgi:hypothetical protein
MRPSPRFAVTLTAVTSVAALLAAAPARAEAPTAPPVSCETGPHSGTYDGEAETVTEMVCVELRHASAHGPHVVSVSKLGSATFLSVTDATGDTRRLQIAGLEEVPVAAPRIATAVTQKTTTSATQQVDNIVDEDQRVLKRQKGEMLVGLGLAGLHAGSASVLPAVNLRGAYETTSFAVVGDLRYAFATQNSDATVLTLGLGGRYFFGKNDVAPYLGAGLSYTNQNIGTNSSRYDGNWFGSNDGVGGYAEAGIEALRTHKSRLAFDLRGDVPFYGLKLERFTTTSSTQELTQKKTIYSVPVSFALAYSYRGI